MCTKVAELRFIPKTDSLKVNLCWLPQSIVSSPGRGYTSPEEFVLLFNVTREGQKVKPKLTIKQQRFIHWSESGKAGSQLPNPLPNHLRWDARHVGGIHK